MPCTISKLPYSQPSNGNGGGGGGGGPSMIMPTGYICGPLRWAACSNAVLPPVTTPVGLPLRDGPQNVYVPAVAADWTNLGLPAPTAQWGCQESTGNLVSNIGSVDLAPGGSGHLYQQSVSGWTRKFVGLVNDSVGQCWHSSSTALDLTTNEHMAWLLYASVQSSPAATRSLLKLAASGGAVALQIRQGTDGVRVAWSGNASMSTVHNGIDTVHCYLLFRNTSSGGDLLTDIMNGNIFADNRAFTGSKGLGDDTGAVMSARIGFAAFWKGSDADTIANKTTLQTLGWTVTW